MDQEDPEPVFAVTTELEEDRLRVRVTGEIDMSTADTLLQAATRESAGRILLDLRRVTFFDSAAIHAVLRLADQFSGSLEVLPSRQVNRVLEISGLADQPWLCTD